MKWCRSRHPAKSPQAVVWPRARITAAIGLLRYAEVAIEGGVSAALSAPAVPGVVRCSALVGVEACMRRDKLAIATRLRAVTHQSRDADRRISSKPEKSTAFQIATTPVRQALCFAPDCAFCGRPGVFLRIGFVDRARECEAHLPNHAAGDGQGRASLTRGGARIAFETRSRKVALE